MTIIRHYFKRTLLDPMGIGIYVLFPLILLSLFHVINEYNIPSEVNHYIPGHGYVALVDGVGYIPGVGEIEVGGPMFYVPGVGEISLDDRLGGRNLTASFNLLVNLLIFQFMGSLLVIDFLYVDLREDMRWRLGMAPVSKAKLAFGNMAGSFGFALLSGLILIAVSAFAFDAYLHNVPILLLVLVLVGLISQLMGVLFFFLFKKKSTANTMGTVVSWAMVLGSGMMMGINFGEGVTELASRVTPYGMAVRAVVNSGGVNDLPGIMEIFSGSGINEAWLNVGLLGAVAAALAIVVVFFSRRRLV